MESWPEPPLIPLFEAVIIENPQDSCCSWCSCDGGERWPAPWSPCSWPLPAAPPPSSPGSWLAGATHHHSQVGLVDDDEWWCLALRAMLLFYTPSLRDILSPHNKVNQDNSRQSSKISQTWQLCLCKNIWNVGGKMCGKTRQGPHLTWKASWLGNLTWVNNNMQFCKIVRVNFNS